MRVPPVPGHAAGDQVGVIEAVNALGLRDLDPAFVGDHGGVDIVGGKVHFVLNQPFQDAGGDGAHHVGDGVSPHFHFHVADRPAGQRGLQAAHFFSEGHERPYLRKAAGADAEGHVERVREVGAAQRVQHLVGDLRGHRFLRLARAGAEMGRVQHIGGASRGLSGRGGSCR